MKFFLVIRNMNKENEDVVQFDSWDELKKKEVELHHAGHRGELVPCHGSDMKDFLDTFTEYRPKHWQKLIQKYRK